MTLYTWRCSNRHSDSALITDSVYNVGMTVTFTSCVFFYASEIVKLWMLIQVQSWTTDNPNKAFR